MKDPLVSIIIVVYNNEDYIKRCLNSVLSASYPAKEVVVVDNASTDSTPAILSKFTSKIRHITNTENTGYAAANNQAIKLARGSYVFILNPDTVVSPDFLAPLVARAESSSKIAACQPAIFLLNDRDKLNMTGKQTHYLGFDWIENFGSTIIPASQSMISFSGCGILIKKKLMQAAHMFDQSYFMYYEDTDISWKFRLLGYQIVFEPKSKIYHDYKLFPSEKYLPSKRKMMLLERNRLTTILKNYSARSLIIIFLPMMVVELAMTVYAILGGWGIAKLQSYFFLFKNLDHIQNERSFIQSHRKVNDKSIVSEFSATIDFVYASNPVIKYLINPLLSLYWLLFGKLI
jgi:GT2 family glycosyltransferase